MAATIAFPPDAMTRMLEIKAKSRKSKNIFNADADLKVGGTEASSVFRHDQSWKPAVLCAPRRSSLVFGEEKTPYVTEAHARYNHGAPVAVRKSFKPANSIIANSEVIIRGKTPDSNQTVAMADFQVHEHTPTKRNKVWGNKSNVPLGSDDGQNFVTEAKSRFTGEVGRPATSFKPVRKAATPATFEGVTSAQSAFVLPDGFKYQGRAGKPRAARSEISDQHLIESLDTLGQANFVTEARSNYQQKNRVSNPVVIQTSEGIGFGGGKEDRNFQSEGHTQFEKKERITQPRSKWSMPAKYERVEDDREWVSEARANHTHGGFAANTQNLKKGRLTPSRLSARNSAQASKQPSRVPTAQASKPASKQPSRVPSAQASRVPSAQAKPALQTYIPTISALEAKPASARRPSQYRPEPQNKPKGIAPVTRSRRQSSQPQQSGSRRNSNRARR